MLGELSRRVEAFEPELIVVLGPDHSPASSTLLRADVTVCVGARAHAVGDFEISTDGQSYRAPEAVARGRTTVVGRVKISLELDSPSHFILKLTIPAGHAARP